MQLWVSTLNFRISVKIRFFFLLKCFVFSIFKWRRIKFLRWMYRWIAVLQEAPLHRGQTLVTADVCNHGSVGQRLELPLEFGHAAVWNGLRTDSSSSAVNNRLLGGGWVSWFCDCRLWGGKLLGHALGWLGSVRVGGWISSRVYVSANLGTGRTQLFSSTELK